MSVQYELAHSSRQYGGHSFRGKEQKINSIHTSRIGTNFEAAFGTKFEVEKLSNGFKFRDKNLISTVDLISIFN